MCPAEDRSDTVENNRETFLMSNMQPQLFRLNGVVWKSLEAYVQKLVSKDGFEAYIYAGCYGNNGTIRNKGKVMIPTRCWKVVVLLTEGDNDFRRINKATRIIAVDMPNELSALKNWENYRVKVDAIERRTGYDLLAPLRNDIEAALESRVDRP